jgi:hypothetical protein
MRRTILFFALALVVGLVVGPTSEVSTANDSYSPGAQGVGDPYYPLYGNRGHSLRHDHPPCVEDDLAHLGNWVDPQLDCSQPSEFRHVLSEPLSDDATPYRLDSGRDGSSQPGPRRS